MAIFRVKAIVGAVEIGRHDRAKIGAVLSIVCLTQLDTGYFRDGVRLIGRLQRPVHERLFRYRLFR